MKNFTYENTAPAVTKVSGDSELIVYRDWLDGFWKLFWLGVPVPLGERFRTMRDAVAWGEITFGVRAKRGAR
jgi:hypothetical protein